MKGNNNGNIRKTKTKETGEEERKSIVKSKQSSLAHAASDSALHYSRYPIHECLIPVNLFEQGLGNVVIARKTPEGDIAVSAFIVDIFCLGVKDAFFRLFSEYEYEHRVKYGFIQTQGCGFEEIDESCAKKLLEGAVAYAEGLGFKTHPDYKNAANIFKGVDGGACSVTYVYGKDGKPLYIRGPYESLAHAEKIIDTLQKNAAMADSIMLLEATLPTIIFRRNNTASGRAIRSSLQNPPGCQATCFQQIGYAIMYRQ